VLKLIASQAAISLENARLYTDLRRSEAYLAGAKRLSHSGQFWLATFQRRNLLVGRNLPDLEFKRDDHVYPGITAPT